MAPVILHVEDDLALRAIVSITFQRVGLGGKMLHASTVAQGAQILDAAARDARTLDLIVSDMHLPDGTGLELIRHVRATPAWKTTPMLILSGDHDPRLVGRAYALGANAYINKAPSGRTLGDVITTLYQHWLTDAVRIGSGEDRSAQAVARALKIRLRYARLYQRIAQQLAEDPSEMAFWLGRALGESNLANLLAFVQRQLADRELDDALSVEIAQMQHATDLRLAALEHDLDATKMSREDIYARLIDVLATTDIDVVVRSMARLFPKIPFAVAALRDFLVGTMGEVAAWIDLHTHVRTVRQQAVLLRAAVKAIVDRDEELVAPAS